MVVAYNDNTGLGSMAEEIKSSLGIGKHLVCQSNRLENKKLNERTDFLFDQNTEATLIENFVKGSQGFLCLENVNWHPQLFVIAEKLKMLVICIPMWEWFRGTDEIWKKVDLFICPNEKALKTMHQYGFQNAIQLPWALNIARLPKREIQGKANVFIHNVGLIDEDDRKGTYATIEAFSRIKIADIRLIIRVQKDYDFPKLDSRVTIELGDFNEEGLYGVGEVAIQPSKLEGLGFMVLEPVCCGIPTVTLDVDPVREYVVQNSLHVKRKWFKRKGFSFNVAKVKHAFLYEPSIRDLQKKMEWCIHNELNEVSIENRNGPRKHFYRRN